MPKSRTRKTASMTWGDLDPDNALSARQREIVEVCVAVTDAANRGDRVKRLIMLDFIATFILYEEFGGRLGETQRAVTTHGNHAMDIADRIDEFYHG